MSQTQRKVLVVDDDVEMCEIFGTILGESGYDVRCATSGNAALQILAGERIDLVVSDIMMPNGNGLKVRDDAKQRGIPVILSTGYLDPYKAHLVDGAVVMTKPYSMQDLLDTMQRMHI